MQGNLVHRAVSLCFKNCGGKIPESDVEQPFDLERLRTQTEQHFCAFNTRAAAELAMECARTTNRYLTERAPWQCKDPVLKVKAIYTAVEAIFVLAHFIQPFMPETAGGCAPHMLCWICVCLCVLCVFVHYMCVCVCVCVFVR